MAKKANNDDDPRLDDIEKYWLQLTSYDLDKIFHKTSSRFNLDSKPAKNGFNSSEPSLPDPFQPYPV